MPGTRLHRPRGTFAAAVIGMILLLALAGGAAVSAAAREEPGPEGSGPIHPVPRCFWDARGAFGCEAVHKLPGDDTVASLRFHGTPWSRRDGSPDVAAHSELFGTLKGDQAPAELVVSWIELNGDRTTPGDLGVEELDLVPVDCGEREPATLRAAFDWKAREDTAAAREFLEQHEELVTEPVEFHCGPRDPYAHPPLDGSVNPESWKTYVYTCEADDFTGTVVFDARPADRVIFGVEYSIHPGRHADEQDDWRGDTSEQIDQIKRAEAEHKQRARANVTWIDRGAWPSAFHHELKAGLQGGNALRPLEDGYTRDAFGGDITVKFVFDDKDDDDPSCTIDADIDADLRKPAGR